MDDCIALEALRRGAPGAAEQVIRRHNRTLWRIARSMLRDERDAEDVVQEAYLRAFSRIGEFRGESSVGTWLARITINEALRRLGTRRVPADVAELENQMPAEHAAGPGMPALPNPEQVAARAEIRRMVERAVDALPTPYRLVFVMRVIDQMDTEETGAALGIPAATVKTRLHRANQQLRETLGTELATALEGAFPFAGLRCDRLTRAVLGRLTDPLAGADRLPSSADPG
jgi:RNA polymerase sigma-70 factor (ECF subfamily)